MQIIDDYQPDSSSVRPLIAPLVTDKNPAATQLSMKFQLGLTLQKSGQLAAAKALYAQIIQLQPDHFNALHLLGIIAAQENDAETALKLLLSALEIDKNNAELYNNLAYTYNHLKRYPLAVDCCTSAIAINPDYAEAYCNLGIALEALNQPQAALRNFDQAISLRPAYAEVHYQRAHILTVLEQLDAAIVSYDRAIALKNNFFQAFHNRGRCQAKLGNFVDAVASYDRAIALDSHHAEAYYNRGNALIQLRQLEAAIASYDQALVIKPDYAAACSNRGAALVELKQWALAIASLDKAILLDPAYPEAYYNRGIAYRDLHQTAISVMDFTRAVNLKSDFANAHFNLALSYLLLGNFAAGWPEYEWRWKQGKLKNRVRNFRQPLWLGTESLQDRTILLYSEQGLGDTLQFCRYTKQVNDLGARVILEVPPHLMNLLGTLEGVAQLVASGNELPMFDYQCPLLSLPLAFNTGMDNIPGSQGYIQCDISKREQWHLKLGMPVKPRLGLVWSGSSVHQNDHNRSIPLANFLQLLPEGYQYLSLQKELLKEDQLTLDLRPDILQLGAQLQDYADTAAVIWHMDYIVSVDTSVAHLAGAMGKPVAILLPFNPDWRWMLEREDSPWYPSAKLYRQQQPGAWENVCLRVKRDLENRLPLNAPSGILSATQPADLQIQDKFERGSALQQQGQLALARILYEEILVLQPLHVASLHHLALLEAQSNNLQHATELLGKALKLNPQAARMHHHLGQILLKLKQPAAALASFQTTLQLKPDNAEAHFNAANILQELQQPEAALSHYKEALRLKVDFADAYFNCANTLTELKQHQAALEHYQQTLRYRENFAPAWLNHGNALQALKQHQAALESFDKALQIDPSYAEAYNSRGNALQDLHQHQAALESYGQAICLKPDYAKAYYNRGSIFLELQQYQAAVESYAQAILLKPDYVEAYINRGNALTQLKQLEAAVWNFEQALLLKPDHAEDFYNHGVALQQLLRIEASVASYERAIELKPDYVDAHFNLAFSRLLLGDLKAGWVDYEWRWQQENMRQRLRKFIQPLWLGAEPVHGRTILLHSEQGLGDTLQFCRYAKLVNDLGARVVLEVPPPLKALLGTLDGVTQLLARGEKLPDFDLHCPLLSLPMACNTELANIPAPPGYIGSDAAKVAQGRASLGSQTKPRAGLVWSGSTLHINDQNRSILLRDFVNALPEGFQYLSLQKEVRKEDQLVLDSRTDIMAMGDRLQDYSDTAALIELMDIIVTVDTSVAHLAGAMGKPVLILLPLYPDWRWLLHRSDSPWYPSATLYRQTEIGAWESVFARVKAHLSALL